MVFFILLFFLKKSSKKLPFNIFSQCSIISEKKKKNLNLTGNKVIDKNDLVLFSLEITNISDYIVNDFITIQITIILLDVWLYLYIYVCIRIHLGKKFYLMIIQSCIVIKTHKNCNHKKLI
jgi:hypothetical protein